jgi:hypothetical protein
MPSLEDLRRRKECLESIEWEALSLEEYYELSGLSDVVKQLSLFEACVATEMSYAIMRSLVTLGVRTHEHCGCMSEDRDADVRPGPAWVHAHHAEFNWIVWQLLYGVPRMLLKLRRLLDEHGRAPSTLEQRRVYLRDLAEGLIIQTPIPRWVGTASAS